MGTECYIIDYRCPAIDSQYNLKPLKFNSSLFKSIRANLILLPFIKAKKKNFTNWMNNYKRTAVLSKDQLYLLNDQYDYFIVGSDQVWNMKCHGYDLSFFLDFVHDDSKKIAYAASFGTFDICETDRELYKFFLSKFSSISVRELSGGKLVEDLLSKETLTCMDPVLLAGKKFWKSKANYSNIPTQNQYIFVYQLGHDKLLPDYVRALKKATGLKVVYITGHIGNMVHYSIFDKNESSASPERFLALISNAEYVVTNSFHACVLSILFDKQFFVVSNGGEKASYNTRIYNLLADYNLLDCIVDTFSSKHLNISRKYYEIHDLLKHSSVQSINFIKTSLML